MAIQGTEGTEDLGPDPTKHGAILDAAERLFVRYGFKKTTMDEIAAEAGVGKGTIYSYFRSKEELLLAYSDRAATEILAAARKAVSAPGHFCDRLARMMKAILLGCWDRIRRGPHAEEIFHDHWPEILERHLQVTCCEQEMIRELLVEANAAGSVRVEDPAAVAPLIWRAFASWGPPYSAKTGSCREEIEAGIEAMAELLHHGLR